MDWLVSPGQARGDDELPRVDADVGTEAMLGAGLRAPAKVMLPAVPLTSVCENE